MYWHTDIRCMLPYHFILFYFIEWDGMGWDWGKREEEIEGGRFGSSSPSIAERMVVPGVMTRIRSHPRGKS